MRKGTKTAEQALILCPVLPIAVAVAYRVEPFRLAGAMVLGHAGT